jgi:hypothetical protein
MAGPSLLTGQVQSASDAGPGKEERERELASTQPCDPPVGALAYGILGMGQSSIVYITVHDSG